LNPGPASKVMKVTDILNPAFLHELSSRLQFAKNLIHDRKPVASLA
jgi:hypothetical protein